MVREHLDGRPVSDEQRLLIGAYFTKEYSVEAAALFNPSIVPHPDQSGLSPGECRIIVSLRATGEGHVSSIGFRSGVIDAAGEITIDPASRYVTTPEIISAPIFDKHTFDLKLFEMGVHNDIAEIVLEDLPPQFTAEDLGQGIDNLRRTGHRPGEFPQDRRCDWVARPQQLRRRIFRRTAPCPSGSYFPVSENESRGIEDARFVRFRRRWGGHLLRDLHRFQRIRGPAADDRDAGFPLVQDLDAQRQVRSEQGHGPLSAQA